MMVETKELDVLVKQVLLKEPSEGDSILTQSDVDCLICEEGADDSPRGSIFGYPSHPLYRELSNMLNVWIETKHCPILDLPSYNLLDEQQYNQYRSVTVYSLTPMLTGLQSLWDFWTPLEKAYRIRDILKTLGRRGIMDLLGVRKTMGSADLWPVSRELLMQSFSRKQTSGSELTVGARALAKHCHRDMSLTWWGNSTGNEQAKNQHALSVVTRILNEATWINIHCLPVLKCIVSTWINIHCLPGDLKTLEVRQPEGYGVRWAADGSSFRGFVEPQMVDGHSVGWRH